MTEYDQELFGKFDSSIKNHCIVVHENDNVNNLIKDFEKHFPFSLGRIDWSKRKCVFFSEFTGNGNKFQLAKRVRTNNS